MAVTTKLCHLLLLRICKILFYICFDYLGFFRKILRKSFTEFFFKFSAQRVGLHIQYNTDFFCCAKFRNQPARILPYRRRSQKQFPSSLRRPQ